MNLAYSMQKFQDWFTQQWVIITGQKFNPKIDEWLMGPFGTIESVGEKFIYQLANDEQLYIDRNSDAKGLFKSIENLNLSKEDLKNLSDKIIDFYEHTSNYQLDFQAKWSPFFKPFAWIVNKLFSQRINQLHIPLKNNGQEKLCSEIIHLIDQKTKEIKYTFWLRKFETTNEVVYSGIYGTCPLPSGQICIKAVFPLPKGNATVILKPRVGRNNELILEGSGRNFGDPGFYFLLSDAKNNVWTKFIRSFTDQLIIKEIENQLIAKQIIKLWKLKVVELSYKIIYKQYQLK